MQPVAKRGFMQSITSANYCDPSVEIGLLLSRNLAGGRMLSLGMGAFKWIHVAEMPEF